MNLVDLLQKQTTHQWTRYAAVLLAVALYVNVAAATAATSSQRAVISSATPASVSVTISPTSAALNPGGTQSYTVSVGGTTATGVTWSLSPSVGSLKTGGSSAVYTAPATISAAQSITIKATSTADSTKSASASVSLVPIAVGLTPATATLNPGQKQSYSASVSGSTNTAVTWSLSPSVGTISTTSTAATYTAPATVTAAQTITIKATSAADSTKSASATLSLVPPIAVSVTPASVSLTPAKTQQFAATVSGSSNQGVTWSLSPAVGSLSSSGSSAVYTAPTVINAAQAVSVTATSAANTAKNAVATVNLVPQVGVVATPASALLYPSKTQQFTATVSGTTNQGVTWSISPAVGTISSNGLYTAPATITARQTVTVTAKSAANSSSVAAVPLTLSPNGVLFTVNSSGLSSLSFGGQSYYLATNGIMESVSFQAPNGAAVATAMKLSSATATANSFTQVFNAKASGAFTITGTFSAYDAQTVEAVFSITNNDPVNTLAQFAFNNIGVTLPGPWTLSALPVGTPLIINQYNGVPVTFMGGSWGSVAMWLGAAPATAEQKSFWNSATQTAFTNAAQNYAIYGPNTYSTPILPGQTQQYTQYVRFGASTDTAASLAPEAYSQYRSELPYQVSWTDRRPIAQWFIADATNGRSATNPRGYLWNNTINITNASAFQSAVFSWVNNALKVENAMTPKPQGVIIWDLEGQEFNQPFTYVGYPTTLPQMAPEMDAIADQVMSMIASAGYRVGVTIRSQSFGIGSMLPPTCNYNSNVDFADKFIDTTAAYPYQGYYCTAPNVWTAATTPNFPNDQVYSPSYNTILNLLASKITYANQRWGATLFYIDTSVWEDGVALDPSIFRTLQAEFPNFLLIPEESNDAIFSATAPLEQAAAFGYYGTSQQTRAIYPGAFGVVNIAGANTTANFSTLVQSVASGDILMFPGWWQAPEVSAAQQIYAAAGVQ